MSTLQAPPHASPGREADSALDRSAKRLPRPSTGWKGTAVRLLFGGIFAIDAVLKWRPGFRHQYLSTIKSAASGQPAWLHGWFHFWINLQSGAPTAWATLVGLTETTLAIVLIFGIARRAGYLLGAVYTIFLWAVGEGFGGPYTAVSASAGTSSSCASCPGGASWPNRMPLTVSTARRVSSRSSSVAPRCRGPTQRGPTPRADRASLGWGLLPCPGGLRWAIQDSNLGPLPYQRRAGVVSSRLQ
jgi:uncharacterized membrane protein YphA (DoxX/SURF4 family)